MVWSAECSLRKVNFTLHLRVNLSRCASEHGRPTSEVSPRMRQRRVKHQEITTQARTHALRTHTHFFKTRQSLISRLLIPDILYQAFYLLFIHFHNDLRCYSERSLVNPEPLASILSSGCVLSAAVLGLMCALAPISQLYLVVMIS